MSEHLPSPSRPEIYTPAAEQESEPRSDKAETLRPDVADKKTDSLDNIHKSIEQHAKSAREMAPAEQEQNERTYIGREDKREMLRRTLERTQRQLPTFSRIFSKAAHSKPVFAASELGGKTIARPSAMLGGGIGAFLGSTTVLLLARKYGFSYNFGSFLVFFAGGLLVGLTLELAYKLLRRSK
jgi:hypothetical protein